jgi:hypothetical protein
MQPLPRIAGDAPDPRRHPFGSGIALSSGLWIPRAFRLLAFASWIIPFPLRSWAFLAVRVLVGRHTAPRSSQTSLGLRRSAPMSCDRGGCLLSTGGVVSGVATSTLATHSQGPHASLSCPVFSPSWSAILRRLAVTMVHRRFTFVHPSGLPLACGSLMAGRPWASVPPLHTPLLPATHGRVGTGVGHWPESSLSSRPLIECDFVNASRPQLDVRQPIEASGEGERSGCLTGRFQPRRSYPDGSWTTIHRKPGRYCAVTRVSTIAPWPSRTLIDVSPIDPQ